MRPISLEQRRAKRRAAQRQSSGSRNGKAIRASLADGLHSYLREANEAIRAVPIEDVARAAEEILRARDNGRTVYVLGNGGSAATASHAVCNWQKPSHDDDEGGVRTVSLTDNVALLTAWANDSSFENAFAAQLRSALKGGDLVIAVSGSGNSPNVLRGVEAARDMGVTTIGFCGFDGGLLASMVDVSVVIPSDIQEVIEDVHMMLVHALSGVLRATAQGRYSEDHDSAPIRAAVRS